MIRFDNEFILLGELVVNELEFPEKLQPATIVVKAPRDCEVDCRQPQLLWNDQHYRQNRLKKMEKLSLRSFSTLFLRFTIVRRNKFFSSIFDLKDRSNPQSPFVRYENFLWAELTAWQTIFTLLNLLEKEDSHRFLIRRIDLNEKKITNNWCNGQCLIFQSHWKRILWFFYDLFLFLSLWTEETIEFKKTGFYAILNELARSFSLKSGAFRRFWSKYKQ